MKKILTVAAVAFCVGFLCQSARAYEKAITDTTDYIVQNAADAAGQNSVISGNHFPGGTPVAGKKYLVNGGLTTRSPNGSGSYTFVGDSFTLDEGANFVLKGVGSTVTIANLIVYNALISQGDGNSAKTLAGGMTVYGTPTAPSFIQGSGNGGTRRLILNSDISGAAGTCGGERRHRSRLPVLRQEVHVPPAGPAGNHRQNGSGVIPEKDPFG